MSDKEEIMQVFGFSYVDCDGKAYTKIIETPGVTWHECMDGYVKFLESVFGYDIKNQVRLEEPKWLSTMYDNHHDYLDPWTGKYFNDEDEKEIGNDDLGDW